MRYGGSSGGGEDGTWFFNVRSAGDINKDFILVPVRVAQAGNYSVALTMKATNYDPAMELQVNGVAVGKVQGTEAALAIVDALREVQALRGYAPLHAVRGDLLQQAGRVDEACVEFTRASELTGNTHERKLLLARAAACTVNAEAP